MASRSVKLKAFVADAAPHMADLVAQMLHGLGIRAVTTAHTLAATRTALESTSFDVILLDGELGENYGVAAVAALRRDPAHRNHATPVIMMCANPSAAMIAAARDAGVNEFLRKPFSAQHIKLRLDAIHNGARVFIEDGAYTGPDRRRTARPTTQERRAAKPAAG